MYEDNNSPLTRVLKRYLKSISEIENTKGFVRVKDIAQKLGVSMASVSSALKKLSSYGYIDYEKYDFVRFTVKGRNLVDKIEYNFHVIYRFLVNVLNIDKKISLEQAEEFCLDVHSSVIQSMEHILSSKSKLL